MEEFRRIFELPEIRTAVVTVVSASFKAKACCIAYCCHFITILLPSYYHFVSNTCGSDMQHLQESAKNCKAAAFLLSLFSLMLIFNHCMVLAFARTWLSAQDLQVTDPDVLFKLLDDGDKQLTAESFLQIQ